MLINCPHRTRMHARQPSSFLLTKRFAMKHNGTHNQQTNLLTTTLALRFQAKGGVFIAGGGVMTKLLTSILDIPGRSFNKNEDQSIGGKERAQESCP